MTEATNPGPLPGDLGSVRSRDDGSVEIRFTRFLAHSPERVWSALTDPQEMRHWFTEARVEGREGGLVELDFGAEGRAEGRVMAFDPPNLLEHTWVEEGVESRVRWELHAVEEGTLLLLTHSGLPPGSGTEYGAGWHDFLDLLPPHLGGESLEGRPDRYRELKGIYEAVPGLDLLLRQATLVHRSIQANLRDITHAESVARPAGRANPLNWVLGHLLRSYEQALPLLGQEPVMGEARLSPYARGGAGDADDGPDLLPLEELASAWEEAHRRLEAGLAGADREILSREGPPTPARRDGDTVLHFLADLLFHQAYHAGQTGILRRATGKDGAIP